jgi:hypothetical protein
MSTANRSRDPIRSHRIEAGGHPPILIKAFVTVGQRKTIYAKPEIYY